MQHHYGLVSFFYYNFQFNVIIDREAREIICLVVSVHPSVRLCVYALTSELFDTWNTVQDLFVFVSNQEMFAIKSCAQRSRAFNLGVILGSPGHGLLLGFMGYEELIVLAHFQWGPKAESHLNKSWCKQRGKQTDTTKCIISPAPWSINMAKEHLHIWYSCFIWRTLFKTRPTFHIPKSFCLVAFPTFIELGT